MKLQLERGSIDLTAFDQDIRQVLEELFLLINVSYAMPPEVDGAVTVDLHHAPYQEALDMILGERFTFHIDLHNVIHIHKRGTTWLPGNPHID